VANHAFALLLACNRKVCQIDRRIRAGERVPSVFGSGLAAAGIGRVGSLRGETLGLVALGNIAQGVARRAQPFGLHVIAHDPFVDPAIAEALGVELVSLDELLERSDYVSVHAPLSDATRGMIGAAELARCKPGASVVLTSRGGVVDEAALHDALASGHLGGAGVDVWDPEPVSADKPLMQLDNVIGTPHFAFYSEASIVQLAERVAESAADVIRGFTPRWVANPEVLARTALAPSRR
jgi:D-3-phosphoglycerate dehydrogenase